MMSKRHCDNVRVFRNSIRVCVDPEGEVLALRTYSRERGRHGCFLILREALMEWYEGNRSRAFYDADCGHILELRIHAGIALFQIMWLSTDSFGNVYGFKQSFEVPETKLFDLLYENRPVQHLHYDRPRQARIHAERAEGMLCTIQSKPLERRAFSKAMRDCFQWRDEEVYLYPDWCNSFYFETKSGYPKCGDLIQHDVTVRTSRGQARKLYYSVHTGSQLGVSLQAYPGLNKKEAYPLKERIKQYVPILSIDDSMAIEPGRIHRECNQIELEIRYDAGGVNYMTGASSPRGYYLHAVPMDVVDCGSYHTFRTALGTGVKDCLLEVKRQTDKQLEIACSMAVERAHLLLE